jgi:hypothetical protein
VVELQFIVLEVRKLGVGGARSFSIAIESVVAALEYLVKAAVVRIWAYPFGAAVSQWSAAEGTSVFRKLIPGSLQFLLEVFDRLSRGKPFEFRSRVLLVEVGANLAENLDSNILRSEILSPDCNLVGERGAEVEDLPPCHTVPNWNNDPALINLTADQSREFTLWPRLPDEVLTDDNDPKA